MKTLLASLALVLAAASACYTGAQLDPGAGDPTAEVAPAIPVNASSGGDLPCDVAALLAESCASCHGEPLAGGAKNRLLDAADLAAPSKIDPSRTAADDAVARMKDAARPMPPTGLLGADRVAILEQWIAAGMPNGSCDAGGGSPVSSPTVCTSNRRWTRGDHGSSSMHPGVACIDCHRSTDEDDAPLYRIAGTVYPTAHEPDDCYGATGSITVEITDANGKAYSLPVNGAGNFFSTARIATPYTAKVVSGGRTRAMVAPQTNGDCNVCHTEQGAEKAPGRIMTP